VAPAMKKQVNLLKKLGAPQQLIDSFVEVCEINSQLPEDMRSDFPTLLEEQCRKFGFHDILPDGWLFRPYASAGANHRNDTAVMGAEPEAPTIEQAYRRGVAQGFSLCRQLVQDKREMDIERHEKRIARWRKRSVQRFGSPPGNEERPPRKLFGGRYSISNKIRWLVLQRDQFRCVKCGQAASSTVSLEVDHIVPVAKGGLDTIENLQALCNRCNCGKTDTTSEP
jgi:5-methylcytosine-specific restriction endonuclease McrA